MKKEEIINKIEEIKKELQFLENEIKQIEPKDVLLEQNESNQVLNEDSEFEQLKKLLYSEEWPEAVSELQIVNQDSEEEKLERAEGIVDLLIEDEISNKKFLDFGCGEGHAAKYASSLASISVGYDMTKNQRSKLNWENKENNLLLTTNFEKVKEEGPYEIILMYDVIDHTEQITETLKMARSVLSEKGKIYLRCHPWSGRHGGHLYKQINKAFIHLIFTEEEIKKMGYKYEEKNQKIVLPIITYSKYIKESGLIQTEKEPELEKQKPEAFFEKNKLILKRLKESINIEGFPEFQMSQCFVDYVLIK